MAEHQLAGVTIQGPWVLARVGGAVEVGRATEVGVTGGNCP